MFASVLRRARTVRVLLMPTLLACSTSHRDAPHPVPFGRESRDSAAAVEATGTLARVLADGTAPGLQYVVVRADRVLLDHAGGVADLATGRAIDANTTLMSYSMSKTLTAVAVLQLVEVGKVRLDDPIACYVGTHPYGDGVTVRQVLAHTGGLPNPLPLRWVHPAAAHARHDDGAALDAVLREHADPADAPGRRYRYSNIGYWLLGRLVERVSGEPFPQYLEAHVLRPLGAAPGALGFTVPDSARHARGYLERWSMMNLVAPLLIDGALRGDARGRWVNIKDHYVNGAAFGGVVGTARGFAVFLQDQLRDSSAVLGVEGRRLLAQQQSRSDGELVPMTLGWHVEHINGQRVLYKEGGGGGFHAMMRVYPDAGMASVVLLNATAPDVRRLMNEVDARFLASGQ